MKPSRKHDRQGQRTRTRERESRKRPKIHASADIATWRAVGRVEAISEFLEQTDGLKWTKALFLVLLEELHVSDEFETIIGPPENLPARRWPQAIGLAIALRHSWHPDDLGAITTALSPAASERGLSRKRGRRVPR